MTYCALLTLKGVPAWMTGYMATGKGKQQVLFSGS